MSDFPTLDWKAIRETKGECPVCNDPDDRSRRCVNRGFSCDGDTVDYENAEIACRESTRKHECYANGACRFCGWHFCDEHGSDYGLHAQSCKAGVTQ